MEEDPTLMEYQGCREATYEAANWHILHKNGATTYYECDEAAKDQAENP